MVIRNIKKSQWEHVYRQIIFFGRARPLSLQFDIDINCNGVDYILTVQPDKKRSVIALQAMGVYPSTEHYDKKDYKLIEDNVLISALLDIIIYQGVNKRT